MGSNAIVPAKLAADHSFRFHVPQTMITIRIEMPPSPPPPQPATVTLFQLPPPASSSTLLAHASSEPKVDDQLLQIKQELEEGEIASPQLPTNVPSQLSPEHGSTADGGHLDFVVHKAYLCHYSGFYRKFFAVSRSKPEIRQTTMFKDIDAAQLGMIVNWIYHQKVEDSLGVPLKLPELCQLWILAEQFDMPRLQNNIMGQIRACLGGKVPGAMNFFPEMVKIATAHQQGHNKVCRMVVLALVMMRDKPIFYRLIDNDLLPLEMLRQVTKELKVQQDAKKSKGDTAECFFPE